MGPATTLPADTEKDLVTWILASQQDGDRATRQDVLDRATEAFAVVHDYERPTPFTPGWYQRFIARHSELKTAKASVLSKPRNAVDQEIVVDFFHELVHALSCVGIDPSRVFNMDETSFSPTKTAKKVVVHRSSKQVYVEDSSASSHVTVVACVSADGFKVPPLFILPGDRVSVDVCERLEIPGASVTTSEKGWTNS
ncbi:hypothetical protein As57867_002534, partial [Aphanomyces stellatus]